MSEDFTDEDVQRVQSALGKALAKYDEDTDPMEWHPCDDCPYPSQPCPCSGQPWVEESFARAALSAVESHE